MAKYILHSDGGSRGNPGPSGLGFSIVNSSNEEILYGAAYVGVQTNNQAEYQALIWGLKNAHTLSDITELEIYADSELIIKQLKGEYKVSKPELKTLYIETQSLLEGFNSFLLTHVKRSFNKRADELANIAMDTEDLSGNYNVEPEFDSLQLFSTGNELKVENKKVLRNYELSVSETMKFSKHAQHTMTWRVELCISKRLHDELESKLIDTRILKDILQDFLQEFNNSNISEINYFKEHSASAEHIAEYIYHKAQACDKLKAFNINYICIHMSETNFLKYFEGE
ncbi:MAG: reverse transcriptase-like protein [Corynebacterium sp.]|nr:reverse transcriptase-like protein [Corynebacterium sp.]